MMNSVCVGVECELILDKKLPVALAVARDGAPRPRPRRARPARVGIDLEHLARACPQKHSLPRAPRHPNSTPHSAKRIRPISKHTPTTPHTPKALGTHTLNTNTSPHTTEKVPKGTFKPEMAAMAGDGATEGCGVAGDLGAMAIDADGRDSVVPNRLAGSGMQQRASVGGGTVDGRAGVDGKAADA